MSEPAKVYSNTADSYWPERLSVAPAPHEHKWKAVGLVSHPVVGLQIGDPITVIQSCECGEVRRVEVP